MLQRYRRMLRRRVRLSLMDWLLIVLFLIVWMVASRPVSPVPTERAIPYIKTSGHVLVQLAKRPEHSETETYAVTSERDDDELLLTVDANGQRKEIVLVHEPMKRMAIVSKTTHVFAIEQFLLDYHPVHTVLYSPHPDPDSLSGDGKR